MLCSVRQMPLEWTLQGRRHFRGCRLKALILARYVLQFRLDKSRMFGYMYSMSMMIILSNQYKYIYAHTSSCELTACVPRRANPMASTKWTRSWVHATAPTPHWPGVAATTHLAATPIERSTFLQTSTGPHPHSHPPTPLHLLPPRHLHPQTAPLRDPRLGSRAVQKRALVWALVWVFVWLSPCWWCLSSCAGGAMRAMPPWNLWVLRPIIPWSPAVGLLLGLLLRV